jgi:hypothetical protein
MSTPFPLQLNYQTGFNLYAVVRGIVAGTLQYWNPTLNTGAGGWEAFNSGHWAQYAIAVTEDANSGYYHGAYPVNTQLVANGGPVHTFETYYERAGGSPSLGDAPAADLGFSQGANVDAIATDANVPVTLQQALVSEQRGAAAGTPTASVIPTNLTSAQANAYQGRAVIFTSGAAFQCVGRIVAYAVSGGTLTLAAPLPVAPSAGDLFVIV